MSKEILPVRAELVAAKLDKARNFQNPPVLDEIMEEPRLVELLWFLQYVSQTQNYPGGLTRFASDLVAESVDLISTPAMIANAGKQYTEAVRSAILNELPPSLRWNVKTERWLSPADFLCDADSSESAEWQRKEEERQREHSSRKARWLSMTEADVLKLCTDAAEEGLAQYLEELCEQPHVRFRRPKDETSFCGGVAPRHFPRCAEAILRFMDKRKAATGAKIAETEVTRHCFRWLEKASKLPGRGIMIEGSSRYGKTDACRTWCEMNPGRARFVRTPPAGGESELLRAVALALGIDCSVRRRAVDLRAEIEFILRHSGLTLVFDEGQFLLPSNFSRNTTPARLNWIRCNVLDAGCPAVFITTPQSYGGARAKFVKATGYAMQQFDGRILKTVLPEEVSKEDLFSIAKIHFPGVAELLLEIVVLRLAATERNFVSDVSNIATIAFLNAEIEGRKIPTLSDIKAAMADVLRAPELPTLPTPEKSSVVDPLPAPRKRQKAAFQRPCSAPATDLHAREITPAGWTPDAQPLERFSPAEIESMQPT